MNYILHNELKNKKICVILPICDDDTDNLRLNEIGSMNYEASIDSTCFSKPIISFTVNSLEK